MKNFNFLLVSLCFVALIINGSDGCKIRQSNKRMICYFANWAGFRRAPANIQPEDFDPCLCTHVLYSFVDLKNSVLQLTEVDKSKNMTYKIFFFF